MYFLFDIGGTKMRFAVSKDGENLESFTVFDTPENFEDSTLIIKNYLSSFDNFKIEKVCGSLPGTFDKGKTELLFSKNLQGWVEKPIKKDFEKILEAEVVLANDADMEGLGEAVYGAGKGNEVVAFLTISTGVGGTRIVNGRPDKSSMGFEPGYQIIDIDGSLDPTFLKPNARYESKIGYLQRLISGKDVSERFGNEIDKISDSKIWDEITKYLAAGINNILVFWSPDVIVLGGGVAMSEHLHIETVNKYLENIQLAYTNLPPIKKAQLGDQAGLWGALEFLKKVN